MKNLSFDCSFYCRMISNEMYTSAFVGLAVSGASDWVFIFVVIFV